MNIQQAITFAGGTQTALARLLGVSQPAVAHWKARGAVPPLQQLRLAQISGAQAARGCARIKALNVVHHAISFAGSQSKLARLLGVSPSAVANWKARGAMPELQQLRLKMSCR